MNLTHMIDEIIRIGDLPIAAARSSAEIASPIFDIASLSESSPTDQKLRSFLDGLSAASIFSLLVIMYLGRGDFGAIDLINRYEQMSDTFEKTDWVPPS